MPFHVVIIDDEIRRCTLYITYYRFEFYLRYRVAGRLGFAVKLTILNLVSKYQSVAKKFLGTV